MAKFGNSVIDLAYLCSYLFVLASLILGSIIVVADDVKYAEGSLAGFHTVGSGVGALLILLGILACCFGIPASCIELIWPANGKKEVLSEDWLMQYASKIPIIYRDEYNITAYGLENLHPFDSQKYGHIVEQLVEQKLLQTSDLIKPEMVSTSDLLFVHSRLYLASLHSTLVLTRILEIPVILALPSVLVRWKVINPMRFQTQGTILAGRVALERGWCINLGGFTFISCLLFPSRCFVSCHLWSCVIFKKERKSNREDKVMFTQCGTKP